MHSTLQPTHPPEPHQLAQALLRQVGAASLFMGTRFANQDLFSALASIEPILEPSFLIQEPRKASPPCKRTPCSMIQDPKVYSYSRLEARPNSSRRAQVPVQSELGVPVHAQPPKNIFTTTPTTWTGAKSHTDNSTGAKALVTKAAATGTSQTYTTTTVWTTEEWTDTFLQPTPSRSVGR
ncbi:hypothetical protein FBU30_006118 [Linnemannia zychae]|nr:hypothetical protein FBU30_006118 [Linnemannia zychae]